MKAPIPNKQLGQHWLYDVSTLQAMCDIAQVGPEDVVLEIGPGLGTLTKMLVTRAKRVIAVEFDAQLAAQLSTRVKAANLVVKNQDVLKFDLTVLPTNYKVIANVPYYITSKITRMLLESTNPPISSTLLVQKEVAQRMAAKPGDMSILAVAAQFFAEVTLGQVVPAELFTPPPQVDSQITNLKRREEPLFAIDTKLYFKVVRAGFSEKRKKVRNSLSGGLQLQKTAIEDLLNQADVGQDVRAEELSLQQWYKIAKVYQKGICNDYS